MTQSPPDDQLILALDLGCTKHIVVLADSAGHVLAREQAPTFAQAGGDSLVDRVGVTVETLAERADVDERSIAVVSVGAPGPLDRAGGVLFDPPQLPWGDYPLGPRLSERFRGAPFLIDNDCKVGGIGEWKLGAARDAETLVYFGIGTGIGGCVVVDGKVQYGASDNGSEIGHLVVRLDGPLCGCGNRGCLEGIASGSGMERRARELAELGAAPGMLEMAGGKPEHITGAIIHQAAQAGDLEAGTLVEDGIRALGAAAGGLINTLSPDVVVLGGGIPARHGASYVARINELAHRHALGPNKDHSPVVAAELGNDSVILGAVHLGVAHLQATASVQ